MPELPEVETVRRSLQPIVGRRIEGVDVWESRLRRPVPESLAWHLDGRTIVAVHRRGKYLLFSLADDLWLLAHLGMSGALLVQPAGTERVRHDHVRIRLSGERQLTFNDPRRFGVLRVGPLAELDEIARLGPDPLDETFTAAHLFALTRKRKKPIKNLLMDQPLIAGVGNIYANEALFRAGIRPGRQAAALTRREGEALFVALQGCLREAIELGGSSISDYRDSDGRTGYFQLTLAVYDRAGEPCRRCAHEVRRRVHAGRSSFYCPHCQR